MNRRLLVLTSGIEAVLAVVLAGCGSANSPASPTGTAKVSGTVNVVYAGSLANMMEHDLGPGFAKATGAQYQGYAGGSSAMANQIKGGLRRSDVFISASLDVNTTLEGQSNGDWVTWYISFAKAPLVIGYNPSSHFAQDFKTKPWYQVLLEPGIKVGGTDPALDPKGKLTVQALQRAETVYSQSGLAARLEGAMRVFPEEDLVGRLQSGQLDAGFFYSNEAREANIPTVSLGSVELSATYTVSVLERAPNRSGAIAFVAYLLGPAGRSILKKHGLTVLTYTVSGNRKYLPRQLTKLVPSGG